MIVGTRTTRTINTTDALMMFFCLPQVGNVNSTNTRQKKKKLLHIPRTYTGSRSITVKGPKLWNNLPSNVKNCNNLSPSSHTLSPFYTLLPLPLNPLSPSSQALSPLYTLLPLPLQLNKKRRCKRTEE